MRSILPLAAVAAACLAAPAFAQSAAPDLRVVVSYADLDLASPAGQARLDRRIRTAVALACGPVSDADPAGKNRVRECRRTAEAQVAGQRDRALAAAAPTHLASRR